MIMTTVNQVMLNRWTTWTPWTMYLWHQIPDRHLRNPAGLCSSQLPKIFFKRHVVVQNVEIHSKEIVSVRAWGQCNRNGRSIWSRNRLVLPFKYAQMSITARILVGNACEWTNGRLSLASYLALTISPTRHVGIRNEYAYWTCNEHGQELLSCNIPLQQN